MNMRDDKVNWYAPGEVKVSKLSPEEMEAWEKKKAEYIKKKIKGELARRKVLKLDVDGYTNSVIGRKQRRLRRK